jgi:two-component system, OmpR family, phosphate regulon sensor histidine kinase PhoR
MALTRNRWSFFLWPLVGLLVASGLRELTIWQYERVWRTTQGALISEQFDFVCRIVESSDLTSEELSQVARSSLSGQLELLPDVGSEPDRSVRRLKTPGIEWSTEPDGFRRVRLARELRVKESSLWAVFTKRVPPMDPSFYRWTMWLIPSGAALGIIASWLKARRKKWLSRYIRSLQSLRSQPQSSLPRDAMIKMFPEEPFSNEVHHELISLVENFLARYTEIQSGAEQSENVLAAMPVGILAFSPDLRLSFSNRAGIDMLDLKEAVRENARLIELIREPKVVELITESQRAGHTMDAELERTVNQTVLRLRAYPLQLEPGGVHASGRSPMLLIVTDETRLRQLEYARRDFTANVSHELKTPLASIKAYAETLLMGAINDPDARERFVQRISEQAARLDNLIHDLLQLTKIQSLPSRLTLTSMPIYDLIRTCVDEHQPIAASRNVTLNNGVKDESIRVHAEHEAVRTILDNLLSNAIRYSGPGGVVDVVLTAQQGKIDISVIDNGIGIPESDLDHIFERFYRVDKARSQDAGGTGLGLAIVKYLVEALGGSIRVSSKLGEGSTFTVRLEQDRSSIGPAPRLSGDHEQSAKTS